MRMDKHVYLLEAKGIHLCVGKCGDKFKMVTFCDEQRIEFETKEAGEKFLKENSEKLNYDELSVVGHLYAD